MIILPERAAPRGKFLMPMRRAEWLWPSQRASLRDPENQTRWRLAARLHDGHIVWRGWFDDREDVDTFMWALAAGSLPYERATWDLPSPHWRPGMGEELQYDFATVTFLTTPGAGTYTVPSDWNSGNNFVEGLGGGGGGGGGNNSNCGGGGGGMYAKIANFSTSAGSSISINVGIAGAAGTSGNGSAGGNTTWNTSTLIANGGSPGAGGNGVAGAGGAGGTSGTGSTTFDGGAGATGTAATRGGGGGGAAGLHGVGNAASSSTVAGGSGDAGFGGAGGATNNTAGGAGAEWDASHGSGGGGAGSTVNPSTGGAGGNYGGGGAGMRSGGASNGAAGTQGILVVTYTPSSIVNLPSLSLLGM